MGWRCQDTKIDYSLIHLIYLNRTDANDNDFKSLVLLLDQELRVRDGDDHLFYAQFNALVRINHVVVAYLDGEVAGCGAFRSFDPGIAEIKRMFVSPTSRRRGIAAQILKELESWALEEQFKTCILETGFNQPEAIALYQKSGYTVIPNYGPYIGISNSVCMKKLINV